MTTTSKSLFEDALKLPESDRAALAAWLFETLEPESDDDVEQAWEHEIRRRLDELDSGAVQPIPWSEARRIVAKC